MVGILLTVSCEASAPRARPPVPAPLAPPVVTAPAVPVAVDTTGWARANDSAFGAGTRFHEIVRPSCHADAGCAAPANVPTCPALPDAKPVEALFENVEKLNGERVVVRGKLTTHATITLSECSLGCCNGSGGSIGMGPLRFVDRERPKAFRCGGDDSILCCGFELVDVDVVVSGTVKGNAEYAELEDAALCAVRSAADALPDASFEAEGCMVDGTFRKSNETFVHGQQRCACYGGRIYCRRDGCFHAGSWYARGEGRPIGKSCSQCRCEDDWKCERQSCWIHALTSFPVGSTQLEATERESFRRLGARFAQGARVEIELRGYGHAAEGKSALSLSRKRAEAIARELVRGGVPRSWIVVRALGAANEPEHARPTHVEIRVRDHELPQRDPPRPP